MYAPAFSTQGDAIETFHVSNQIWLSYNALVYENLRRCLWVISPTSAAPNVEHLPPVDLMVLEN